MLNGIERRKRHGAPTQVSRGARMRRFRSAFSAAAIVLAITGMSLSSAATAASRAPLGYQLLCLKSPQECKGGGAASVEASEDVLRTLKRVNAHVNRAITPRNDRG